MLLLLSFGSIPNFNDPLLRKKKEKKTVKQTFTKEIDELVSCASISNRKKHNANLGKDQKGSLRQKRLQKPNKSIPFVKTKISDKKPTTTIHLSPITWAFSSELYVVAKVLKAYYLIPRKKKYVYVFSISISSS